MCNPDFKSKGGAAVEKASTSKSKTISPEIPSGFNRRKVSITTTMMGLVVFYNLVIWAFKDSTLWLRPAAEYCREEHVVDESGRCSRSDLFAFQAASAVMQYYMAGMGFYAWHWSKSVTHKLPQTPEGRLFGYLEDADRLLVGIFVYQTFDFFASMLVPEHNTTVFLAHHALASLTAWMSLEYQMVHYYAVFFGGCSEISTIFLVLVDFDVYFPAEHGSLWGMIILFCQVSFTFSFLYYRVIGWWQVSLGLWKDILYAHSKGIIEDYRPGKAWFLYAFLAMDVMLGSLQLYWFFFGIVPKILEILG